MKEKKLTKEEKKELKKKEKETKKKQQLDALGAIIASTNGVVGLESVKHLAKDMILAASTISSQEARFLVDYYYLCQEDRKRANNQMDALSKTGEPNQVVTYLAEQANTLEVQVKKMLDAYTDGHPIGKWIKNHYGIGPVIAAGMLAHIDITKAPTAGHIWSFAGLNPNAVWEKGKKRPWNADLKTLTWKLGQCLMKFANHEDCYYGHIYQKAKAEYVTKNENGLYSEQAKRDLESGKYRKKDYDDTDGVVDETDEGFKKAEFYLKQGKLPPAQIDARARRYAVKIFLSHLHQVWYEWHFKVPAPKPFALAILGHAHMIEPPSKIIETAVSISH